jgi:hypothetical protein
VTRRFALRYSPFYRALLTALGLGPRHAFVEIGEEVVRVRMGWAFSGAVPRSSIRRAQRAPRVRLTAGVHGWGGRWLVNGAGVGIVAIEIDPPAAGEVCGVRVSLRELHVSVEQPEALLAELGFDLQ